MVPACYSVVGEIFRHRKHSIIARKDPLDNCTVVVPVAVGKFAWYNTKLDGPPRSNNVTRSDVRYRWDVVSSYQFRSETLLFLTFVRIFLLLATSFLRRLADWNEAKHDVIWMIFNFSYLFNYRLSSERTCWKLYRVWCCFNQRNVTNTLAKVSLIAKQR